MIWQFWEELLPESDEYSRLSASFEGILAFCEIIPVFAGLVS